MGVEITHAFLSYVEKMSCEGVMALLAKELDFFGRHRIASHTPHRPKSLASTKAGGKGVG